MKGTRVKVTWPEEDETIHGLQKQTAQLRTAIQQPPKKASTCDKHNTDQMGSSSDTKGRSYQHRHNKYDKSKIQCYQCEGWGYVVHECTSALLNGKGGKAAKPPTCPLKDEEPRETKWSVKMTSQ